MPLRGLLINGEPVTFDKIPYDVLPPEMSKAFMQEDRPGLHVTDLGICAFHAVRQKTMDYFEPIERAYNLLRGNAWDHFSQKNPREGGLYQFTCSRDINGTTIVGTPDVIDTINGDIDDYKAPGRNHSGMPRDSYVQQLNIYRWLTYPKLSEMGVEIKRLFLNFMGPTVPHRKEVEIWPFENVEEVLKIKLDNFFWVEENGGLGRCRDPKCWFCKHADGGDMLWIRP